MPVFILHTDGKRVFTKPITVLHGPNCWRFHCKCGVPGEFAKRQRKVHCICGRVHQKRARRAR